MRYKINSTDEKIIIKFKRIYSNRINSSLEELMDFTIVGNKLFLFFREEISKYEIKRDKIEFVKNLKIRIPHKVFRFVEGSNKSNNAVVFISEDKLIIRLLELFKGDFFAELDLNFNLDLIYSFKFCRIDNEKLFFTYGNSLYRYLIKKGETEELIKFDNNIFVGLNCLGNLVNVFMVNTDRSDISIVSIDLNTYKIVGEKIVDIFSNYVFYKNNFITYSSLKRRIAIFDKNFEIISSKRILDQYPIKQVYINNNNLFFLANYNHTNNRRLLERINLYKIETYKTIKS